MNVTYVLVIDTFHEHQFSVGPLGMGLVLKGPAQLLNGHIPLKVVVVCRTGERKKDGLMTSNGMAPRCLA